MNYQAPDRREERALPPQHYPRLQEPNGVPYRRFRLGPYLAALGIAAILFGVGWFSYSLSAEYERNKLRAAQKSEIEARPPASAPLEEQISQLKARPDVVPTEVDSLENASRKATPLLASLSENRPEATTSFRNRARTRFTASRGQVQQIIPGIFMQVQNIDARNGRFTGWLQWKGDSELLWLNDRTTLQRIPVRVPNASRESPEYDVVVTGLNSQGITGYVIFPPAEESRRDRPAQNSGRWK